MFIGNNEINEQNGENQSFPRKNIRPRKASPLQGMWVTTDIVKCLNENPIERMRILGLENLTQAKNNNGVFINHFGAPFKIIGLDDMPE